MEADDFLPHQMHIGRPEFFELFRIIHNAGRGQVVHQGVEPYIHHVLRVKGHRNAPGEAGAGHAEVLQAALHELDHFISAGFRLNEIGMFFDIFHPAVRIFGHFKEIGILTHPLQRTAAVRADMVRRKLVFRPEGFVGDAVPAFILAKVNVSLVIGPLEQHLNHLLMTFFGGTDEIVVGNIEFLPQLLEKGHNAVYVLDRRNPCFLRLLLDLLSVLVTAGQKEHIIAVQSLETGHAVRNGRTVGMSDVQLRTGIVNGGGNIIRWFFTHKKTSCIVFGEKNILFSLQYSLL